MRNVSRIEGALTRVPDAWRMSLSLGLSSALHVAALSSLVLPLPSSVPIPSAMLVRLSAGQSGPGDSVIFGGRSRAEPVSAHKPSSDRAGQGAATPLPGAPAHLLEKVAQSQVAPHSLAAQLSEPDRGVAPESAPVAGVREAGADMSAGVTRLVLAEQAGTAGGGDQTLASDKEGRQGAPVPAGSIAIPLPAPRTLRAPPPEYPEEARWEKRTGRVTLGFRLEPDGVVAEVRMLHSSGHADLDTAAARSLRHWRFTPPQGELMASWYRYAFRFELN